MACVGCFCKDRFNWCAFGCHLPHRNTPLWFWYPWPDTYLDKVRGAAQLLGDRSVERLNANLA